MWRKYYTLGSGLITSFVWSEMLTETAYDQYPIT